MPPPPLGRDSHPHPGSLPAHPDSNPATCVRLISRQSDEASKVTHHPRRRATPRSISWLKPSRRSGAERFRPSGGHLRKLIAIRMINSHQAECGKKLRRSEQQTAVMRASPDNEGLDEMFLRGMRDGHRSGPGLRHKMGDLGEASGKVRETAEIL